MYLLDTRVTSNKEAGKNSPASRRSSKTSDLFVASPKRGLRHSFVVASRGRLIFELSNLARFLLYKVESFA